MPDFTHGDVQRAYRVHRAVKRRIGWVVLAVLFSAFFVAAWTVAAGGAPQARGSITRGKSYAQAVCSACHAIGVQERRSPPPTAPTFATIADTPGMTRIALSAWLNTSHPTMPNFVIDPRKIDDLSAYILSLKAPPRTPL